jgi:hypothetical protein
METVILLRDEVSPSVIRGTLYAKDKTFQILERPWKNNTRNESCIPETGDISKPYRAVFLSRSASGRYKNIYHIQNVPNRGGILIHQGNVVDHTRGCLIIGKKRGNLAGKLAVLNSRTALNEFVLLMEEKPFELIIVGGTTKPKIN